MSEFADYNKSFDKFEELFVSMDEIFGFLRNISEIWKYWF